MLGSVSLGKKYYGSDISVIHVNESNCMINFLKKAGYPIQARIGVHDLFHEVTWKNHFQCLFTCPPYGDKEQWLHVPSSPITCDDWIDICLKNFKCKRYLFVVDDTEKYKAYIVDEIINKSHLNKNNEYVILIDNK